MQVIYMKTLIEKAKDLEELALFLSEINKRKESHIGFCGVEANEIHHTLKEDFISDDGGINFIIARDHSGKMIAAIGLDIDETTAEVWGPFNQCSSNELQFQIWEKLLNDHPNVKNFRFFINQKNTQQQQFMDEIKAEKTGKHLIIVVKEQDFHKVSEMKSTDFIASYFRDFEKLHNESFPGTYYDAKTIVERLDDGNSLKVMRNEANKLLGYAYYEVDAEFEDASLEYLSISKSAQNKGLGTALLKDVLTDMFSTPQITKVRLTVEHTNSRANHMYKNAGFKLQDSLFSYHVKLVDKN